MNRTTIAIASVIIAPILLPASSPAYNLFDYWLSPQGVCTASNPNDPGTYSYQYSAGRNCSVAGRGSLPLYIVAKGGWADESMAVDSGCLYILTERHPNLCNGNYNYRLWDVSGIYGLKWAKTTFTSTTVTWSHPAHTLRCGPSCGSLSLNISMGAGEYNEQGILGMIWDKLYDCRSGTCIGPIPMETMVTRGYWGQHNGTSCGTHFDHAEEYWYGRGDITNDGVANPQSLGLVRFVSSLYNHTTCTYYEDSSASTWVSYLKNCTLVGSCPYC